MLGRFLARIVRDPIGAVAVLVVAGAWAAIAVNALWMQSGPHPAPYFSREELTEVPALPVPKPERRVSSIDPGGAADAERARTAEREAAMIRDLQSELKRRNFYQGAVDGRFGPQTETAIRDYEHAAGLAETGEPTDVLLAHIKLSSLSVTPLPLPNPLKAANQDVTAQPSEQPAGQAGGDALGALLARTETEPTAAIEPKPVKTVTITPAALPQAEAPAPLPVQTSSAASSVDRRIEAVQSILADLGYAPGSIDGRMSAATKRAIEDFEVDRGLPMTGEISPRLLQELSAVSGVPLG